MLTQSVESDTKESVSADDYVHMCTAVRTEQSEAQPPKEDPDSQAAQDDSNITESLQTNSGTAAGTARYPSRTHHPPDYFHNTY